MEEVELKNFIFHFRLIPEVLEQSPILLHCLAGFARRASHIERDISFHEEIIHLKPREFITGRISTASKLGITEGEFRGAYKKLVKLGYIKTIKVTNHYTISLYCDDKVFFVYTEYNLPADKPSNSPTANQQSTTNNTENTVNTETDIKSRLETSPLKSRESVPYKDEFSGVSQEKKFRQNSAGEDPTSHKDPAMGKALADIAERYPWLRRDKK